MQMVSGVLANACGMAKEFQKIPLEQHIIPNCQLIKEMQTANGLMATVFAME
jgi:hypothetical protein